MENTETKPKTIVLYGSSDDLFEMEGALHEEWSLFGREHGRIGCSDGTLIERKYEGNWRLSIKHAGPGFLSHIPAVGDQREHDQPYKNCTSYSDLVILDAEKVSWVLCE